MPCSAVQAGASCIAILNPCGDAGAAAVLASALAPLLRGAPVAAAAAGAPAATGAAAAANDFDAKTEAASASMYFHYYGMLQHQQNMLQDTTRTGTYYWAMVGNGGDFEGKVVVDVGAGSGILSLFAVQACA
jgi:hypothetical protein